MTALQEYFYTVLELEATKTACHEVLMPFSFRRADCIGLWHDVLDGLFCMAPSLKVRFCLLAPLHTKCKLTRALSSFAHLLSYKWQSCLSWLLLSLRMPVWSGSSRNGCDKQRLSTSLHVPARQRRQYMEDIQAEMASVVAAAVHQGWIPIEEMLDLLDGNADTVLSAQTCRQVQPRRRGTGVGALDCAALPEPPSGR